MHFPVYKKRENTLTHKRIFRLLVQMGFISDKTQSTFHYISYDITHQLELFDSIPLRNLSFVDVYSLTRDSLELDHSHKFTESTDVFFKLFKGPFKHQWDTNNATPVWKFTTALSDVVLIPHFLNKVPCKGKLALIIDETHYTWNNSKLDLNVNYAFRIVPHKITGTWFFSIEVVKEPGESPIPFSIGDPRLVRANHLAPLIALTTLIIEVDEPDILLQTNKQRQELISQIKVENKGFQGIFKPFIQPS